MRYKLLGKTGIRVSELCLGAMTFGNDWGFGADETESKKIFDAFINVGGNFIDTANLYTKGTSEKILSSLIQEERDNLVIASKYSLTESSKVNKGGNHIKNMNQSIEGSLKRLKTDYIDLYYVHAWDFTVAPDEVMKNLEYLVSSGKVLSLGISDAPAWITAKCNTIAEMRGWTPFSAYQVEYCLTERTADREIIPVNEHFNMLFCGFGPLAAGLLSGKYNDKSNNDPKRMKHGSSPRLTQENLALASQLIDLANSWGFTPSQVAIKWAMQSYPHSSPIFGARSLKQCNENMEVLNFNLREDQMNALNSLSAIPPNNPNTFLKMPRVQEILYANNLKNIDF